MRGEGSVSVAFFGDGAANRGTFHEGLNLAALWGLPVVFVCENNGFGQWTRHEQASAVPTVAERAAAYGIPGQRADGNDAEVVFGVASEAIQRARSGLGPTLLEFETYRTRDHSGGRDQRKYRDRAEIDQWRLRDPLAVNRRKIVQRGIATDEFLDALEHQEDERILAAASEADSYPTPSPMSALEDVTDYG
jgi:pyruvate dehydrogenase E1 component alpha subunit